MNAERIRVFLDENPRVHRDFECEALKIIDAGFKRYSARTIMEHLRHHSALRADPDEIYKINNDIIPTLARDFMDAHPDAPKNFFALREATAIRKGVE